MLFIFYKLSGDYFVAFIGADWWFWNYEILQFNVFVKGGWGLDVKFWTFAGGGFTKMELVQKRGKGVQILVILWQRNNWMSPYERDGRNSNSNKDRRQCRFTVHRRHKLSIFQMKKISSVTRHQISQIL